MIRSQRKFIRHAGDGYEQEIKLMEEKHRIARDLHDDIGPLLWKSKTKLQDLIRVDHEHKDELKTLAATNDKIAAMMKQIANDAFPQALVQAGLAGAIRNFLLEYLDTTVQFKLELEEISELPLNIKAHILRIVQEVIQNAVKHAEAREVTIRLRERNNKLQLICADNGKGIDRRLQQRSGIGMVNIKERTTVIGGSMTTTSTRGKGTAYIFEIPIEKWKQPG
ncbi:MAG: sensor histidine kinase [Flavisolibacter sp.]